MSYIGNNLQTAFPSYLNIDDISGSFDGVTTSFPLTVGGVAPVPAPLSSNQCLISVGGVVQRPDDSGTEGFLLSGGNIVFSAAPAALDDFFGVILAGADYVNVGVNFPSGTAAAPSITFDTDLDTGVYNPGANEIGFTTAGVNRVTINSSGNVSIVNDLTVDTNTLHVDSTNNRVGIGTTSPSEALHVKSTSATQLILERDGTTSQISSVIFKDGSGDQNRISSTDSNLVFGYGASNTEAARIDSSGKLLVGTSSSASVGDSAASKLQIKGNTGGSGTAAILSLQRDESPTSITSGEYLGTIIFTAGDGSPFAEITGIADGTAGSGDYPGRLTFSTTADGASSPTERMRIGQSGYAKFSNTGSYFGASSSYHERNNNASDWVAVDRNSNGTPFGVLFEFDSDPNGTGNQFWRCRGAGNTRAELRSNGGLANYSANNVNLSDRNAKKDIELAAGTWDCLKEWEIVNFRYKDQPDDSDLNMGVIAQQVVESCPEVVTVFQEAKEATETEPAQEERIGVKEQHMMWMAIKALQEAQLRIETLEAEVAALKAS